MQKLLELPGKLETKESPPVQNDDGLAQKAQEARVLLKRIEERELERRKVEEYDGIRKDLAKNRNKGGYCGCL